MTPERGKLILVIVAILGNIAIGAFYPDARQLALANLGVAIGGYFGNLETRSGR